MELGPIQTIFHSYYSPNQAELLSGLIFGLSIKNQALYEDLKTVGLLHLFVFSGSNIRIIIQTIEPISLKLGRKLATILNIAIVVGIVLMLTPHASLVRAAIMSIYSQIAILYGKQYTAAFALLCSFIVIYFFKNEWVTGLSFQLSFCATFGIITFSRKLNKRKKGVVNKILEYISSELQTCIAASAFTIPLIFYHYRTISLISPLSNLLVSWLIGPTIIVGFIGALLGLMNREIGGIVSALCLLPTSYMLWIISNLAKIPFASISF